VTTIICRNPVPVGEVGELMRGLYRRLDSHSILGKSQILILDDCMSCIDETPDRNYDYLQELEYLARNQKYDRLRDETEQLIIKWCREERTQIWMEGRVRQICYLLQRYGAGNPDYRECEFLLDEAFANMEGTKQFAQNICDILLKSMPEDCVEQQKESTERFFDSVKEYINIHIAESLNLQQVSHAVGVSQPYLSKLFRKYEDTSFTSYLTCIRMERAKQLLQGENKVLVKEVAEKVGYKDQFYFSRIFYSYTGMRPSEYIERGQSSDL
jgi:YesN/AraC family two-component response regulator